MIDCKGLETPFNTLKKLKRNEGIKFHDATLYRSVIGSLQYVVFIRFELASVNKLSQFKLNPRQSHWTTCKGVLRYLKNTMNMCLKFKKSEYLDLITYMKIGLMILMIEDQSVATVYLGDNLVARSSRK